MLSECQQIEWERGCLSESLSPQGRALLRVMFSLMTNATSCSSSRRDEASKHRLVVSYSMGLGLVCKRKIPLPSVITSKYCFDNSDSWVK